MNNILHPLARFLVAVIFLLSGVGKLFGFSDTAQMMAGAGFPAPSVFLLCAIVLELVGGTLLLVGYKTRYAAVAVIVFIVPATIIFHATGIGDPVHGQEQMINTLINLAIIGALIKFAADGAGALALITSEQKKTFCRKTNKLRSMSVKFAQNRREDNKL